MKQLFLFIILLLSISSCDTYSEEEIKSFDSQIKSYLKKHDIKCKHSASGLYYQIHDEGKGDFIQLTDNVSFTYKGTLINGKVFDYQKKTVTFEVKDLIEGWKEIMMKLKPGGSVFLAIPPTLGYGDKDLDDIPKNSILFFEMEVEAVF